MTLITQDTLTRLMKKYGPPVILLIISLAWWFFGGSESAPPDTPPGAGNTPPPNTQPSAFEYEWLLWFFGAAGMWIGGDFLIKRLALDARTRYATMGLAAILAMTGIGQLLEGADPFDGWLEGLSGIFVLPSVINTSLDFDSNSLLGWTISLGIVTIAVAYLWGLVRTILDGASFWSKFAFGIVTTFAVITMLGWLSHMGAQSVLGPDLANQIVTGAQNTIQDGARQLVTEDQRLNVELIGTFDWGVFAGWSVVGIITLVMLTQAIKGNRIIIIPLGIAGLIFFLVVGGYHAYKLEPVTEAVDFVGERLGSLGIPSVTFPSRTNPCPNREISARNHDTPQFIELTGECSNVRFQDSAQTSYAYGRVFVEDVAGNMVEHTSPNGMWDLFYCRTIWGNLGTPEGRTMEFGIMDNVLGANGGRMRVRLELTLKNLRRGGAQMYCPRW